MLAVVMLTKSHVMAVFYRYYCIIRTEASHLLILECVDWKLVSSKICSFVVDLEAMLPFRHS